jgi:aryl-alcohol dehydrogenase-like predicted oxidoreductase
MIYRTLGKTGLVVSALSLGTMQFGQAANIGRLGQEETNAMVRFVIDHGVNFIDTADVYSAGESETLIGNAVRGMREELIIATKVRLPMSDNINRSGLHRVNIIRGVESSLRRLQTDYIDLYQVHSWDSYTPIEETLRSLDDLVRQGKVRYIGLSNYLAWQAALALGMQRQLGLEPYVSAQMYYSMVGRDLEHDWFSFSEYTGMGILVWSALAGGFLSGKYDRHNPPPKGTRFGDANRFVPFDDDYGYRVLDAVKRVAVRHGVSPVTVAIGWVLAQKPVSSVIVAARTHEQLLDNLKAADLKLTDEDMRELDEASHPGTPYPKWMVLQHDQAEDPRARTLEPERFVDGEPWTDLRFRNWFNR